ncbi:MAG: tetratricopeptide repeat protein [Candidatus Micrarchaeia archaeon]
MRTISRSGFLVRSTIAASIAFSACAGPMAERRHTSQTSVEVSDVSVVRPDAQAPETTGYSVATNPFELNARLREIAGSLSGTDRQKVDAIFSRLHSGATGGITVLDMSGQPPRTAGEALASGGDCTDLANIVIALFREANIAGGAMVVHFNSAPANTDHMVPYFQSGSDRIIVDLQAATLGQTAQGTYRTIMAMTFAQAASMYHREMGDYLRDQGRAADARTSYQRATEIFDGDAYAHQNLGILLERSGEMESASVHFRRAAEIDPSYRRDASRGDANAALQVYNRSLDEAERAYREGRYADCVRHFRSALSSGAPIPDADRASIQRNISVCESRQ